MHGAMGVVWDVVWVGSVSMVHAVERCRAAAVVDCVRRRCAAGEWVSWVVVEGEGMCDAVGVGGVSC